MCRLLRELADTAGFAKSPSKRKPNKIQESKKITTKKTPLSKRFTVIRVNGGLRLVRL